MLEFVPEELRKLDTAMYLKNMVNKNKIDEYTNMRVNANTVGKHGTLGDIPLRILTSETEAENEQWKNSQEMFKAWSTDSKQRIIEDTNHNMHQYVPDEVAFEILSLIENPD
jgi:hypothetical protein